MKDRTYTPGEIQKKFDSLPEDIKSLVYSSDMLTTIQKIGQQYKLHIDQLDVLEAETADVMTGFTEPENFASSIAERLAIDKQTADKIAQDINDQLFVKIRESMKKTYEQQKTGNEKPTTPTPPTPVPPTPAPQVKPVVPPQPSPAQKPPTITLADLALSQKTVSMPPKPASGGQLLASSNTTPNQSAPKQEVVKPPPYKADPYREPAE